MADIEPSGVVLVPCKLSRLSASGDEQEGAEVVSFEGVLS